MPKAFPKEFDPIIRVFHAICPLSEKETADIVQFLSVRKLKRKEFFLKEGQVCNKIAFLNSGMIRHYYHARHNEVTRWVSLQGDFSTSLRSFILQTPSIEYLQAISDCELVVFDRKAFEHWMGQNEIFRNIWMKTLESTYIAIEERVFSLIENSAEEKFDWMVRYQPRFIQQVPVMYVASMLGITPRHLSRLKKQLNSAK